MKITNNWNMPRGMVEFVRRDMDLIPQREEFRVTRLITPPQITQLTIRHHDKIEQDVVDFIWLIFGTKVHEKLEIDGESYLTEQTLRHQVNGKTVKGTIDILDTKDGVLIGDYKTCSVYQYGKEPKNEWIMQQNIYRYLLFKVKGILAERLVIYRIFKDWRRSELVRKGEEYPPVPAMPLELPILDFSEVEKYIEERIALHENAYKLSDTELPPCSEEDVWEQPTTYAVTKRGSARATRVFDSWVDAHAFAQASSKRDVYDVETRPGTRNRCANYCPVAGFCQQYQLYLKNNGVEK